MLAAFAFVEDSRRQCVKFPLVQVQSIYGGFFYMCQECENVNVGLTF